MLNRFITSTAGVVLLMGVVMDCVAAGTPNGSVASAYYDAVPRIDRSDTLLGTDADSNGVRDDIDAYLSATYTSSGQLSAATQMAKAMRNTLKVDPTDRLAVKLVDRQNSRAIHCLYSKFEGGTVSKEPSRVVSEIESMTSNTKKRLLAYLKYNRALDGTSSSLPDEDTCE